MVAGTIIKCDKSSYDSTFDGIFFFKWKNIVNSKIYAVFPFERSPHPLGTLARRYDRLGSFGLLLAWNMYLNIWTSYNNRSIFCSSLFSFVFALFANWHYYLYVHLHSKLLSNDLVVFIQDARAHANCFDKILRRKHLNEKNNSNNHLSHRANNIPTQNIYLYDVCKYEQEMESLVLSSTIYTVFEIVIKVDILICDSKNCCLILSKSSYSLII